MIFTTSDLMSWNWAFWRIMITTKRLTIRPIAKEALTAILDDMKAFGVTKIHAGTALKNTPSVALLKSLGFELTSTEQICFFKDDAGNDIYFEGGNFTKDLALERK